MYEALFDHQLCIKPGMLVHVCNPRDWNVEEEGQQFNVAPPSITSSKSSGMYKTLDPLKNISENIKV